MHFAHSFYSSGQHELIVSGSRAFTAVVMVQVARKVFQLSAKPGSVSTALPTSENMETRGLATLGVSHFRVWRMEKATEAQC